ncbi:ABC transporter permease [Chloroflexota bacterium]
MRNYIIRRSLIGLLTLWLVSMIVFGLVRVTGDPTYIMVEPGASMQEIQDLRAHWGLDRPIIVQYAVFMGNILKGDFGMSIVSGWPNFDLYVQRLPASLQLAFTAFAIALVFGISMGVLSALKVGGFFDSFGKIFAYLGLAIPSFWLGLMFILLFAVYLKILPVSGRGGIEHIIMPATCLAMHICASYLRLTRSSLLEVLGRDYIRFTRIKGLPELLVVGKHAFRNAFIPLVTYGGVQLAIMINGGVVVEMVFAWPGTGLLLRDAIMTRDYALVQTIVLITATIVVIANLCVDTLYAYIDPRIRLN